MADTAEARFLIISNRLGYRGRVLTKRLLSVGNRCTAARRSPGPRTLDPCRRPDRCPCFVPPSPVRGRTPPPSTCRRTSVSRAGKERGDARTETFAAFLLPPVGFPGVQTYISIHRWHQLVRVYLYIPFFRLQRFSRARSCLLACFFATFPLGVAPTRFLGHHPHLLRVPPPPRVHRRCRLR